MRNAECVRPLKTTISVNGVAPPVNIGLLAPNPLGWYIVLPIISQYCRGYILSRHKSVLKFFLIVAVSGHLQPVASFQQPVSLPSGASILLLNNICYHPILPLLIIQFLISVVIEMYFCVMSFWLFKTTLLKIGSLLVSTWALIRLQS